MAPDTIPLLTAPTGHRLVDVEIAGEGRRFLVDSGAGVVVLTPALADDLGIVEGRTREAAAVDGRVSVVLTELEGLSVAGRAFPVLDAAVVDLSSAMAYIGPFDGVLGRGFFEGADVLLDLGAGTLTVLAPGTLADLHPGVPSVPFALRGGNPSMAVEIGGRRGHTILDTGANGSLLPDAWARRAHLPVGSGDSAISGAAGVRVPVGEASGVVVLAGEDLGTVHFGTRPDERHATLGLDALGERLVGLSYQDRRLYLPRAASVDPAMPAWPTQ